MTAKNAKPEAKPTANLAPKMTPKAKTERAPKLDLTKPPAKVATIADLAVAFPAHLLTIGKTPSTAKSYHCDLRVAVAHFGEKTKLGSLTARKTTSYFESDLVLLGRNGQPKNPITIAKLRRVFRLALVWAADAGHVKEAPLPAAK